MHKNPYFSFKLVILLFSRFLSSGMGCFTKQSMHVCCLHPGFANMGKVGSASMGERERENQRFGGFGWKEIYGQVLTIPCLFKEKRSDSKIYWVHMIPSQDAIPRKAEYIWVNSLYIYGSCWTRLQRNQWLNKWVIRSCSPMESKMRIKERKQSNPIEHVILPSSVVSVFNVLVVGHVCGPQDAGKFCTS